jgi:hypothetical protein
VNVSAREIEPNVMVCPVADEPPRVPGPAKTCQPAAAFVGSNNAKYGVAPAASPLPAANVNENEGVETSESVAGGMNVTKSKGVRFEPPIERGDRADDCTTGAPAGAAARSCVFTGPLVPLAAGNVTPALFPLTVPMEAVVPGRTETDAALGAVEGDVVGLEAGTVGATEGMVPKDPPPLHATNALTRTMSASSEGRKWTHVSVKGRSLLHA